LVELAYWGQGLGWLVISALLTCNLPLKWGQARVVIESDLSGAADPIIGCC